MYKQGDRGVPTALILFLKNVLVLPQEEVKLDIESRLEVLKRDIQGNKGADELIEKVENI